LAEEALNQACAYIQERLGQDAGDVAGLFFTSEDGDAILDLLHRYIEMELSYTEQELDFTLDTERDATGFVVQLKEPTSEEEKELLYFVREDRGDRVLVSAMNGLSTQYAIQVTEVINKKDLVIK